LRGPFSFLLGRPSPSRNPASPWPTFNLPFPTNNEVFLHPVVVAVVRLRLRRRRLRLPLHAATAAAAATAGDELLQKPTETPPIPHLPADSVGPGEGEKGKGAEDVEDRVEVGLCWRRRDDELKEMEEGDRGVYGLVE
jgi:hypothetical protein